MRYPLQLQVQDFKAGFEFLVRKAQDTKCNDEALAAARLRVHELEGELATQQVCGLRSRRGAASGVSVIPVRRLKRMHYIRSLCL